MRGVLSGALGFALGLVLLIAGCAPETPTKTATETVTVAPTPAPKTTVAAAATPGVAVAAKSEGTLTAAVAEWYADGIFLPFKTAVGRQVAYSSIYDYLAYMSPDYSKTVPGLAVQWEASADAKVWTISLRKGVQFQDGYGEVTAEDVKFSLETVKRDDAQHSETGQYRKSLDRIEIVDPYKLIVYWKEPVPAFMANLALFGHGILSKKYIDKVGFDEANKHPIGSGPYKFVEYRPGELLKFEAMDQHWRVVPEFKTLIIKLVPEEATRVAMLTRGEADMVPISPATAKEVRGAGLTVFQAKRAYGTAIMLGGLYAPDDPKYDPTVPWLDIRVRQALNLAVNRAAIVQQLYGGAAEMLSVGPYLFQGAEDLKPYPYDPAKAKELLAEAGFRDGFEVPMYVYPMNNVSEMPLIAEAVAMDWARIGVKAKMTPSDYGTVRPMLTAHGLAGKAYTMAPLKKVDYELNLTTGYSKAGSLLQFTHPELEGMVGRYLKLTSLDQRNRMIREEVAPWLYNQYQNIPIAAGSQLWGLGPKVAKEWPIEQGGAGHRWEYVTHANPLNTFRLFTP